MISKKTIKSVTNTLVETYNPLEIYLFGSYAWGQPNDDSDLDLLIVVEESELPSFKRAVKGYLALFDFLVATDILVYTKSEFEEFSSNPEKFCNQVKKEGQKIYAKA